MLVLDSHQINPSPIILVYFSPEVYNNMFPASSQKLI